MVNNLPAKPVETLSYEEAYQQLETVVKSLEAGDQPLEAALELFERGQQLVQRCMSLLEGAELRVKQVSSEGLVDFKNEE